MKCLYKTIATGFGSGYVPIAPGTAGAFVGILLIWGAKWGFGTLSFPSFQLGLGLFIIVITIIGALVTKQLEPEWGEDPSRVVIDEIVGVWVTLFWIPINPTTLFAGFCLFRLFDIWKPLGIRRLESIPNGWGVMLDDVMAGVYANLCLQLGVYLLVL